MSSFKLSLMAMTTMFVFVALMSMQLIAASSIEGVAHANENHREFTKSRFLVSNSMEGVSGRKLLAIYPCPYFPCIGGQTCCGVDPLEPLLRFCFSLATDINNCGTCGNICPLNTPMCCSGKCVNTQNKSTNCGFCGNVCNDVPCTFGFCGYAR
ncbi:hypothetical protein BDL97_13G039900 [Sphagnum fallax]|nr:hypothetical protein BDL97_13G039900 [Sphagnum fallax]